MPSDYPHLPRSAVGSRPVGLQLVPRCHGLVGIVLSNEIAPKINAVNGCKRLLRFQVRTAEQGKERLKAIGNSVPIRPVLPKICHQNGLSATHLGLSSSEHFEGCYSCQDTHWDT